MALNLKIKEPFEIPSCIIILAIEFLCAWIKEPWKNVVWWPAPSGTFQITFGIETATSSRRNWSIQSASLFLGWFVLQNYEKRLRHFWKRQVTIKPIHLTWNGGNLTTISIDTYCIKKWKQHTYAFHIYFYGIFWTQNKLYLNVVELLILYPLILNPFCKIIKSNWFSRDWKSRFGNVICLPYID